MRLRQGAQYEASTVAAWITGLLLNENARSSTHNICVIFLVMLTFILDIVLVGFQEILYHIPWITCKVMEAYEDEHLLNNSVYEFQHMTKSGRIYMIKVSFSQPGCFHGSKVWWNTTDHHNRMGYTKPFIVLKVTVTFILLNHPLIYSISLLPCIEVYNHHFSPNMSTYGSPPESANTAPPCGLLGIEHRREDNSESLGNNSPTATGNDWQVGKQTDQ